MNARTREELINDLLDVAAMLAADEAIPFNRQTPAFSHHVDADTDEAGIHRIDEIAAVLGVEPTRSAGGRHHEAVKMVGGIEYKAVYIERQDMADYSAFMATRPAWNATREIAGAVSEDEPRCPDPECGEPLADIASGAVGHCGRSCAPIEAGAVSE